MWKLVATLLFLFVEKYAQDLQSSQNYNEYMQNVSSCGKVSSLDINCTLMGELICVRESGRCDGVEDCTNGEDEVNCNGKCTSSAIPCMHNHDRCIQRSWRCDEVPDCEDASDEDPLFCSQERAAKIRQISNRCGRPKSYQCDFGQCINETLVCNGNFDCKDNTDEDPIRCRAACSNSPCPHTCLPTPKGPLCRCFEGYALENRADGSTFCKDVNECLDPRPRCPQICENRKGSFHCACHGQFTMKRTSNRLSFCDVNRVERAKDGYIIAVNEDLVYVKRQGLNGTGILLRKLVPHFADIDFDPLNYEIYYRGVKSDEIRYMSLQDKITSVTSHDSLIQVNITKMKLFRLDYVAHNIYVAQRHTVHICTKSGSSCILVVRLSDSEVVADLQLDLYNDRFFLAAYVSNPDQTGLLYGKVSSYFMNGTLLARTIFSLDEAVLDIACDWFSKRVYAVFRRGAKTKLMFLDYDLERAFTADLEPEEIHLLGKSLTIDLSNGMLLRLTQNPFGTILISPIWGKSLHYSFLGEGVRDHIEEMTVVYATNRINFLLRSGEFGHNCVSNGCKEICVHIEGKETCLESANLIDKDKFENQNSYGTVSIVVITIIVLFAVVLVAWSCWFKSSRTICQSRCQ